MVRHYVGGYVYRDSTLEFFAFDEGRVRNYKGNLRYEYDLKDHLPAHRSFSVGEGNVRANFASEDGMPKLLQRDDYYPFGLKFNSTTNGPENKFTYNGKELEDEHGLNWYYYGARFYDPQLGRWHAVDPLDVEHSPYNYAFNDPINYTDPDGTAPLDWIRNNETGEYVWKGNVNSAADTPDGFSYVGKNVSDVYAHFENSLPFYDYFSEPNINFSGWPGEINPGGLDVVSLSVADNPLSMLIGGVGAAKGVSWLGKAKGLFSGGAKSGSKVFWSGGRNPDIMNIAKNFAEKNGMKTLEMTTGGKIMNFLHPYLPRSISGPIWKMLSKNFAKNAKGEAHVFHNATEGIRINPIWKTEYRLLKQNNVKIHYNNVFYNK